MQEDLQNIVLEKTDDLAGKVIDVEADDLQGLSEIHDLLQELSGALEPLGGQDAGAGPNALSISLRAQGLVEQIVMRDVEDASVTLQSVCALVNDLQQLVRTGDGSAQASQDAISTGQQAAAACGTDTASSAAAVAFTDGEPAINKDDLPLLNEFVAEARGHLEAAEAELLKLEETPDDAEAVGAIFRSFHTIKGVAGFLNLRQIGALAHAAESLLDLVRQGRLRFSENLTDSVLQSSDLLKTLIASAEAAGASGQPIPPEPALANMIARLQQCGSGKPVTTQASKPPVVGEVAHEVQTAVHGAPRNGSASTAEASVKIATSRLDALINTVGELVIAQAMVTQDMASSEGGSARLSRNVGHAGKLVRELQALSMSMRMVPIQGLFQKMTRLVRDLGKKLNKEIDLVITGGDTELDRNVVEVLGDPLMHMVRNAGDHGIESPEDRERAGKPRAGRLELSARHEAGCIVIEIIDDGKGLNKAKVIRKAIAAGIVAEGQDLSDQEVCRLIFHAGLSTAEKVTDVSGRGVGMDVVKKNIEALRGQVDIKSIEGKGSTFTIRLPLTLAVIDGLVARVGRQRYIIPTSRIQQSLRPTDDQLSTVQGRGELCLIRGELLPLFRMHRLFNTPGAVETPTEALVVIVEDNGRRCCLMVDELLGQQQMVIKALGEGIGAVPGISGGAILGDGNVSLILDVHGLIDLASIND